MSALRKPEMKHRNATNTEIKQRYAMNIDTDITLSRLLYGSSNLNTVFKNTFPPSESEKRKLKYVKAETEKMRELIMVQYKE